MTLEEKIRAAVTPLVPECVENLYGGDAEEYCTYSFNEIPAGFGDNRARAVRYLCQVHWFLPANRRPRPKKKQLRQALAAVRGFTTPETVNATDETGQHYVYEFQAVDGAV